MTLGYWRHGNHKSQLILSLVVLGFTLGCRGEPAQSTDPQARQKELENLKKNLQKEHGKK